MLRPGEGAGADVGRVGRHRGLDGGTEFAIALDEFRHPRREPEHVLEHEDLAVAGHAAADADGRDLDGSADAPRSSLIAPQPVSFITRAADMKACSLDAS